jgi:hypothetical protein
MTVDDLLAEARSVLAHRPGPAEALATQAKGALLIDIRGDDQRRSGGLIPGAVVLPRNSLEWRCDPASPWRHLVMNYRSRSLILICNAVPQWRLTPPFDHLCGGGGGGGGGVFGRMLLVMPVIPWTFRVIRSTSSRWWG